MPEIIFPLKIGRDRPQGVEIEDANGNCFALIYGETKSQARDIAARVVVLLNESSK